jgi:hypothetical protein
MSLKSGAARQINFIRSLPSGMQGVLKRGNAQTL